MKHLGIVGGVSRDHLVRANEGARFNQPGGPGVYAALSAARLVDVHVTLLSELPSDENDEICATLLQSGVDISHSVRGISPPQLWILDAPEGRRIVPVTIAPDEAEIAPMQELNDSGQLFDRDDLGKFDGILLCAPTQLPNRDEPASGQIRGIDPDQLAIATGGWRYIEDCCRWATVLIPSRVQLRQLGENPLQVAGQIRERFDVDVVAKLDRDGAVVLPREGGAWQAHDTAVKVIETTGAGDTLAGAVVAARMSGSTWQRALAMGVSAARLALSDWGIDGLKAKGVLDVFPDVITEAIDPNTFAR